MLANTNHKILAVGLAAALLGGSVGALVSRSTAPKVSEPTASATTTPAATTTTQPTQMAPAAQTPSAPQTAQTGEAALTPEQIAYRDGFAEGFRAGRNESASARVTSSDSTRATSGERVVYRNVPIRSSSSARRVYYDYNDDRRYVRYRRDNRSFWDRHRDKLTVAIGTGVGAAVGGAVGGKKGALIGALAGAGGSALYTYKLRKRDDRRY